MVYVNDWKTLLDIIFLYLIQYGMMGYLKMLSKRIAIYEKKIIII